MRAFLLLATLLLTPALSVAQTRASAQARAASLPPVLSEDARVSDLLRAAQGALAAGRKREAGEALERAQTRLLDRSVPLGETHNSSDNSMVAQIAKARQALASGDRAGCLETVQAAIDSANQKGL